MKKYFTVLSAVLLYSNFLTAQNIFPPSGRAGIYTTTPAASLQVKGGARIGTLTNYLNVDSATGSLNFVGTAGYRVANNTFAFSSAAVPLAGLYFNAANLRYEFRNTTGVSVFNIGADATGNVGIGTTPSTNKLEVNGTIRSSSTIDAVNGFVMNGQRALFSSSNPTFNTFVGFTPTHDVSTYNTAVGYNALGPGNSGSANTATGAQSLLVNVSGTENAGYGYSALQNNTTGSQNTAIGGRYAGLSNTSGNYNTFIGTDADASTGSLNNATAIGARAKVVASNSMQMGDSNVTNVRTFGTLIAGAVTYPNAHGTSGQVLSTTGSGTLVWSTPSSLWLPSGNDIYNSNIGNVGIGTTTPAAKLDVSGDALINGLTVGQGGGNVVYNTAVGRIALVSNTTGSGNSAFGINALYGNTTGSNNTAIGLGDLQSNTTGNTNTALGVNVLPANSTGNNNVGLGPNTLVANTTGSNNIGVGFSAVFQNTTGNYNIGIGYNALLTNDTGYNNTAIGSFADVSATGLTNATAIGYNAHVSASNSLVLGDNANVGIGTSAPAAKLDVKGDGLINTITIGLGGNNVTSNTALGYQSLHANTVGSQNTASGYNALSSNTEGYNNTANGYNALSSNTTGYENTAIGWDALVGNTTGTYNTATGMSSLIANTSGGHNTANGWASSSSNSTGSYNTAAGYASLNSNTTGNNNTANGYKSLFNNTTGSNNTALGYSANISAGNFSNATVIGANATVDASNKVRVGNTSVSSIGGQVSWTTFSDGRYKKNIKEDVKGLAFINSLKPITYTVDINGLNTYFDKGNKQDSANDKMKKDMQSSADEASKIVYNGFIAQDVEAAAKKLNYNFSGVDKPKTTDGLYGLRYSDFVVPLVKAVQELSTASNTKDSTIATQQQQINNLQSQMNTILQKLTELQAAQQACCNKTSVVEQGSSQSVTLNSGDNASLQQNAPNPFRSTTVINYTLPQHIISAEIIVTDMKGSAMKKIPVAGSGSVTVAAGSLTSGTYKYSLIVDGRLIDTKTMVLTK